MTATATATILYEFDSGRGQVAVARLDPPLRSDEWDDTARLHPYVAVSAVVAPFTGPETYIFPARADAVARRSKVIDKLVTDSGELDGSFRGGLDPDEALRRAGYEVLR